jgi:methionine aminotransferase
MASRGTCSSKPMVFDSKLPDVGTTIFTVMSKLALEHGAINLSQGFPDFDGPPELLARAVHHLTHGHNQYAPMPGVPALREQIVRKVAALYGRNVDMEAEVTVTAGATEAIFCAITAVVRPGDEVIVFDPAYDCYEPAVTLAGGVTVHVPLVLPAFVPDWDRVRDAVTQRTRLLIINTPHNPTGSIWRAADMEALCDLARDHRFYVVGDEVYEHIVFDGARHESLLRFPELYARSFVVSSFGKTFHTTGWKTGYCVAPPELTVELRRIHQYVTFVANTPIQHAFADYMAMAPEHALSLGSFYQTKRDLFIGLLEGSRFEITPSAGTYFQLLDYRHVSNESDVDLARRLTVEAGIASIPVSVFCEHAPELRLLRFCFAKHDTTLARAAEILCRL